MYKNEERSQSAVSLLSKRKKLERCMSSIHDSKSFIKELTNNIDLKHCLKEGQFHDGNALLVDENRNHSDWAKYIKKLVQNPNLIEDMGNRLYETVKVKYHLDTVTKNRSEWYKTLVK